MEHAPQKEVEVPFDDLLLSHAELSAKHAGLVGRLEQAEPLVRPKWEAVIGQLEERISAAAGALAERAPAECGTVQAALSQLEELAEVAQGELAVEIGEEIQVLSKRLLLLSEFVIVKGDEAAQDLAPADGDTDTLGAAQASPAPDNLPTAPASPEIEATAENGVLDKTLSPTTALVLATFLSLIGDELRTLGRDTFDPAHIEALLNQYGDAFSGNEDELQRQRSEALSSVGVLFQDLATIELVFEELSAREADPRSELFLYLVNLYHHDFEGTSEILERLLSEKRELLITLIQPQRSGPMVLGVETALPQLAATPEANQEPAPSFDMLDAAILASFLTTTKGMFERYGLQAPDLTSFNQLAIKSNTYAELHALPPQQLRERLEAVVRLATDTDRVLQLVTELDSEDPRTALLCYIHDALTNSFTPDELIGSMREQSVEQVTLHTPEKIGEVASAPAVDQAEEKGTKRRRPVVETLCRERIGAMLERLAHLNLHDSHAPSAFIQVFGERANKAIGSGKEHGNRMLVAGKASTADMIFAMLRTDGDRKVVEYAKRREKMLRELIVAAIENVMNRE